MKEIRLGTIGSGMIVHTILKHVKALEGIRLAAVYSKSRGEGYRGRSLVLRGSEIDRTGTC